MVVQRTFEAHVHILSLFIERKGFLIRVLSYVVHLNSTPVGSTVNDVVIALRRPRKFQHKNILFLKTDVKD